MRTLIIGSGFVGRTLAGRLAHDSDSVVLASRHRPAEPSDDDPIDWVRLDVTDRDACADVIRAAGADTIVLVHGPSDVTWCEAHPAEALLGHATAAKHVLDLAGDRRVVLISTDNVFDGTGESCDESTPTAPANAYGRAKLAAELALRDAPNSTVLRVSLIYGWEPADSAKWLNFFAACAHRLRAGQPVTVPFDQWTTPVLVEDVAAVTEAVIGASDLPLLHLGGPDRVSRAQWAGIIADELGIGQELVVSEPRSAGRYADRPANSCLSSTLLARHPSTAAIHVRGVADGARALLAPAVFPAPSAP
jgi:dTDP-4-dehydrorhamnose reductase